MSDLVWLNGEIAPRSATSVDPFDHGLTVGDGLFETIAAGDGRAVFWDRHLRRLREAAERLGLAVPFGDDMLARGAARLLSEPGVRRGRARLRLTVTSGPGPPGVERAPAMTTVLMSASGRAVASGPAEVRTVPWVRNERSPLSGTKSTSYGEAPLVLDHVRRLGADEALLADSTGRLSEAVTANVFVAVGGRLVTPSLASGCLPGIVRQVLLDAGIGSEAEVAMDALDEVDEAFLTSSLAGVRPIRAIDGRALGTGPLTAAAGAALRAAVAADADRTWP